MEEDTSESICHILRRFVCDSANQAKLYEQCNISAETAQTNSPIQLHNEPRYASLLQDFSDYWLPADLIDLYFNWPRFIRTCIEHIVPAFRVQWSQDESECPHTDMRTDMIKFALWILDQAAMSEHPRIPAWVGQGLLRHTRNVNALLETGTEDVLTGGDFTTWKGDGVSVKLVQRCPVAYGKAFFKAGGLTSAENLYKGWSVQRNKKTRFRALLER